MAVRGSSSLGEVDDDGSTEASPSAEPVAPASGARVDLSDDRRWLDGFRRGDDDALERTFRAYAPLVVAILQRGTRIEGRYTPGVDLDLQQDLLHDVFVRALGPRARQSYDGLRPYAPFIAQIARRTLIDHHRKVTTRARQTDLYPADALEAFDRSVDDWRPSTPLPEAAAATGQQRARVGAFLNTLDRDDRALVRLRFEEGLSQRDAATAAGTSRQRLRTWEQKIRARLRLFLDPTDGDEPGPGSP